jgi:hypothetical protein
LKKIIKAAFEKVALEISSDTEDTQVITQVTAVEKNNGENLNDVGLPVVHLHRLASSSVVNSIQMVYREWYDGWNGRPSISELLGKNGQDFSWRSKDDKKLYSRRHKIIKEIKKLVDEGNTTESAISILEERRNKMAISSFADTIKL